MGAEETRAAVRPKPDSNGNGVAGQLLRDAFKNGRRWTNKGTEVCSGTTEKKGMSIP